MIPARRVILGLLTAGAALAGAALVAGLLYALSLPGWRGRLDVTTTGSAGLSVRTAETLEGLPEGSRATAFLFEREFPEYLINGAAVMPRAFARMRALLEDARIRSNGRLEVQVLDETSSLVQIEQARTRLARQPREVLILESGEQRQVLRFNSLFEVIPPTDEGGPARLNRERVDEALRQAADRLARSSVPRVGIVTGMPATEAPLVFEKLTRILADEGFEPQFLESPDMAGAADLLLVAGQPDRFRPAGERAAREWVAQGKPLLLALGSGAGPDALQFWNELLDPWKVGFEPGIVCEVPRFQGLVAPGQLPQAELEIPPERLSGQHPITRRLHEGRMAIFFPYARPLAISAGTNALREPVVRSSPDSWQELNNNWQQDRDEIRKSYHLMIAVEDWAPDNPAAGTRMLLLGSGAALRGAVEYSRDWLAPGLRWLLREEAGEAGLAPVETQAFRPDRATLARLSNLSILALPGTAFLVGLMIFFRRRR